MLLDQLHDLSEPQATESPNDENRGVAIKLVRLMGLSLWGPSSKLDPARLPSILAKGQTVPVPGCGHWYSLT